MRQVSCDFTRCTGIPVFSDARMPRDVLLVMASQSERQARAGRRKARRKKRLEKREARLQTREKERQVAAAKLGDLL